jgi:predicted transcriptional regulator
MTTLSLKVPDDLAARLDKAARANRVSRSALCRQALEERLKKVRAPRRSLFEQSKDLCGIGDSGIGDLSSNKKHLDGFGA